MARMTPNKVKRKLSDPAVQPQKAGRWASRWSGLVLLLCCLVVCSLQLFYGHHFFFNLHSQTEVNPAGPLADLPTVRAGDHLPVVEKLKDLNFACNITDKEALSAISRAVTRDCKREIGELVCAIQAGGFYPASLPRYCPAHLQPELQGTRLGCFKDTFAARILPGNFLKLKGENSPASCVKFCQDAGFTYAGTQYGMECFCGNSQPSAAQALQDSACNMPCPGEAGLTCGGYLTMEIYHTGVTSFSPSSLGAEVSEPASPARVVYLLTVNGRALRQVLRLVQRLNSSDSYFLVHVDSRQDYLYREMASRAVNWPNLRMASQRFSTIWGGASLLTMLLASIQELLAMKDWDWDFVLNLSESDYPIKSREDLVRFLAANKDKNFVKSHGREPDKFVKKQGLDKTFYQCENHMWRLGNRQLPLGIQVDGGSDWVCLSREFARYVTDSRDPLVSGLKLVFNHTLLPAESFFHTVLHNSVYCRSYINNNLHLTNWKRKQGCKCQYRAIVDWCGCSPNDFLEDDWSRLEATKSKQLFFARKFEPIVHQEIINRVDDWLELPIGRGQEEERHHYWQNIFHHLDRFPVPSPDFLLLMRGLCQSFLAADPATHGLQLADILEVTVHKYKDDFDAFLVHFRAEAGNAEPPVELEIRVHHVGPATPGSAETRLLDLEVGTDFDPKELVFRNLVRNFGQSAKVSVSLQFAEGPPVSELFEIGWFNPVGRLVATGQLAVNATAGLENLDPKLRPPLMPGIWTLVVVSRALLVAKENFLVIPDGSEINLDNAHVTNSKLSQYVILRPEERLNIAEELKNLSLTTADEWLAKRISTFFTISGACTMGPAALLADWPSCPEESWSSRSPDLKSSLEV